MGSTGFSSFFSSTGAAAVSPSVLAGSSTGAAASAGFSSVAAVVVAGVVSAALASWIGTDCWGSASECSTTAADMFAGLRRVVGGCGYTRGEGSTGGGGGQGRGGEASSGVNYKSVRKEEGSVPAGGSFGGEGSNVRRANVGGENEGGTGRHERAGRVLRCEGWLLGALQGCTEICLCSTSIAAAADPLAVSRLALAPSN